MRRLRPMWVVAALAMAAVGAPAAQASDPLCTGQYGGAAPRAGAPIRFGIDPGIAGSAGGVQLPTTPDDPARDLAGARALHPTGRVVVVRLNRLFLRLLPPGWDIRIQSAITLSDSEPEQDGAVVRGDVHTYDHRHPEPADFGIVIEVTESMLAADRADKFQVYARAGIPEYWIINLVERQVELYTVPSGPGVTPAYAARQDYAATAAVPLTLNGQPVSTIPVADLLP